MRVHMPERTVPSLLDMDGLAKELTFRLSQVSPQLQVIEEAQ